LEKERIPYPIFKRLRKVYETFKKVQFKVSGRPYVKGEANRARQRREREGFFDKYCKGHGLDIGFGGDPVTDDCDGWDFEHGDAQYLKGVEGSKYDFVHSSHTLEHMDDPAVAIDNWWRVIRPGGYLILYVPHRDLYEKKKDLPSRWNVDHKHYFLIDKDEEPVTIGLVPLIERTLSDAEIVYAKECKEGFKDPGPEVHSMGEYSIEVVVKKINQAIN